MPSSVERARRGFLPGSPDEASPRRGPPIRLALVEVCLAEIRPAEVRQGEVRPGEGRPTETRIGKVCLNKVCLAEIRPAEDYLAEVRLEEVRPGEVRPYSQVPRRHRFQASTPSCNCTRCSWFAIAHISSAWPCVHQNQSATSPSLYRPGRTCPSRWTVSFDVIITVNRHPSAFMARMP